jgi:copper oxidase (laccase) domain-containing protein
MAFVENRAGGLLWMTSSLIAAPHAFTTRHGGVSTGIFEALNLGQNLGDDPENVRENYRILGGALGFDPERLALSRQVHGTGVRLVTEDNRFPPFEAIPYEADALITAEKDIPLMILTADCVPILLYDPAVGAVGAVHAGWRGTARDIAGKRSLR